MDTRKKIVPLDRVPRLISEGEWLAVVGYFDPLTALEARRITDLSHSASNGTARRNLLAIVLEKENGVLSVEARAALIAALREVDSVTVSNHFAWRAAVGQSSRVTVAEDAEGENQRLADLAHFILERHHAASILGRQD